MGSTHSIIEDDDGEPTISRQRPRPRPQRRRLSKPRTNSTRRDTSCLPPLHPSKINMPRFSVDKKSAPHNNSDNRQLRAIAYHNIFLSWPVKKSQSDTDAVEVEADEYAQGDTARPLRQYSRTDSTLPAAVTTTVESTPVTSRGSVNKRTPTNSSNTTPTRNSVKAFLGTARRKSLLVAKPPATATRKQSASHQHFMSDDVFPMPGLTIPDLRSNECDRSGTPSGYSVIGAFKRGSLRITNGAASPVPSSLTGSPELRPRSTIHGGSGLAPSADMRNRALAGGRSELSIGTSYSHIEVCLVPASRDGSVPDSPFSFTESPSMYGLPGLDDDDLCDSPLSLNSAESLRLPLQRPSSSKSGAANSTGLAISKKSFSLEPSKDNYDGSEKGESARSSIKICQRTSSDVTDSGYSSQGSIESWKTCRESKLPAASVVLEKVGKEMRSMGMDVTQQGSFRRQRVEEEYDKLKKQSRSRRATVGAIRRRRSQGDLLKPTKSEEPQETPLAPPTKVENKENKIPPSPVIKHRKSMFALIRSPNPEDPRKSITKIEPKALATPLSPAGRPPISRYTADDYLALIGPSTQLDESGSVVGDPTTPTIMPGFYSPLQGGTGVQVKKVRRRVSNITGQEYYQRFSGKGAFSLERDGIICAEV